MNTKYLQTTKATDPAILHYKVLENVQNLNQLNVLLRISSLKERTGLGTDRVEIMNTNRN